MRKRCKNDSEIFINLMNIKYQTMKIIDIVHSVYFYYKFFK